LTTSRRGNFITTNRSNNDMKTLYYHKTSGGAEYLTDKYIITPNGNKEGVFEGAKYIIRIDGDIRKDAELLLSFPPIKELKHEINN
jgi:hypothetical protein